MRLFIFYFLLKEVDQNELMDSKLRCVFAMPPGKEEKFVVEEKYIGSAEPKYESMSAAVSSQPSVSAKVSFTFNISML